MSMQDRFVSLKRRHNELDTEIEAEKLRPSPDTIRLTSLKKQKLRLKEEMGQLSA